LYTWYCQKQNPFKYELVRSTGARGTDHPPFSNFLFANLFSIKFLYFLKI
jgi:hypothetical protein